MYSQYTNDVNLQVSIQRPFNEKSGRERDLEINIQRGFNEGEKEKLLSRNIIQKETYH